MNSLQWGRYWPADSFWHRRDPLAKLGLLAALVSIAVAARRFGALALPGICLAMLWRGAKLPGRLFLGVQRSFSWLIGLTLLTNLLMAPGAGNVLWPPRPSAAGAILSLLNASRLVVLFGLGAWLTATTSPLAMADAIRRALKPLARLGLPVGDLALVIGLGLRLLPDLLAAGGQISLAQKARGVGTGHGWRARLLGAEALALALFAYAFRRADELALAMEVRGFQPGGAYPGAGGKFDALDKLVLFSGLVLVVGFFWYARQRGFFV